MGNTIEKIIYNRNEKKYKKFKLKYEKHLNKFRNEVVEEFMEKNKNEFEKIEYEKQKLRTDKAEFESMFVYTLIKITESTDGLFFTLHTHNKKTNKIKQFKCLHGEDDLYEKLESQMGEYIDLYLIRNNHIDLK